MSLESKKCLGTILLVDDEPEILELLERQLGARNFKIFTAQSGNAALRQLQNNSIDILVTDVRMPGMDGMELMAQAFMLQADLQSVVITGHGDLDTALRAMRLGAYNFLLKPVGVSELEITLKNCLEKIRLKKKVSMQQEALQKAHDELEVRVAVRTDELTQVNHSLSEEIALNAQVLKDLQEKDDQLRHAQKMEALGSLAGGIAHDFNNLLVPILGYSELAMKKLAAGDKLYNNLQRIHQSATSAAGLTRQILAFSRKQVLEVQPLDLNRVIVEFQAILQRIIGEDIEVRTCFEPNLCLVVADKGQIEQVLLNFAVNARDAMPTGGKLTIETANVYLDEEYVVKHIGTLSAGEYVMLAVSDSGLGMDAETQSKIFEPFYTTKEQGEGTGLGLSTTYGIVKQHNGSIWVYSEPGKGTCFKVYLPKVEHKVQTPDAESKTPDFNQGIGTILVVEDAENTRKFICETLEAHGYHVIEAQSSTDALNLLTSDENKIDLLLTDVIMPELNGRELYDKAAATRPGLKVLYMSGYTDNVIVHHGILDDGVSFLQKPFSIQAFLRKVGQMLR